MQIRTVLVLVLLMTLMGCSPYSRADRDTMRRQHDLHMQLMDDAGNASKADDWKRFKELREEDEDLCREIQRRWGVPAHKLPELYR